MKRTCLVLTATLFFYGWLGGVADAGPFRGFRRPFPPAVFPEVNLDANYQPFTDFPPGHSSITVIPGKPAVIPDDPPRPKDEPATVRVIVPDAKAELWFNGHRTTKTGATRTFETPKLTGGRTFHYRVKVVWERDGQRVTEERRVPVRAGQTTTADFTKPPDDRLPLPGP
jgi:uncharacterized protein (TIGR03000 family)